MMNTIKNKISTLWLLVATLLVAPIFVSCEDDEDVDSGADPVVRYFRTTEATQADSMIVSASLGSVIAIVGENLSNVTAIKFNDKEAILNPCYITEDVIVVTVPSGIPSEITNKVYISAKNGNTVEANFEARIPAPMFSSINSLVFAEGQTIDISGNFFVGTEENPIKVMFPGGLTVEVESANYRDISCIVPAGADVTGDIFISTAYGTTKYAQKVNDVYGNNVYCDFDTKMHEAWCSPTVENSNDPISGNYLHYEQQAAGAWTWGNPFGTGSQMGNPLDYTITDKTCLAFEIRTNKPWVAGTFSFQFGNALSGAWETNMLMYAPWAKTGSFDTQGKWQTVFVPLSTPFVDKTGAEVKFKPTEDDIKNGFCVMVWGQYTGTDGSQIGDIDVDMDNFRLVEQ